MYALRPIATAKANSRKSHVCFTPESGHVHCKTECRLWARSGLMQCTNLDRYSINSLASDWNDAGTVNPTFLAVVRAAALRFGGSLFGRAKYKNRNRHANPDANTKTCPDSNESFGGLEVDHEFVLGSSCTARLAGLHLFGMAGLRKPAPTFISGATWTVLLQYILSIL